MTNGIDILVSPGESPFDTLRHTDPTGREYWLGRDLMPHLGYANWQNLAEAIQRARAACANAGQKVERNFRNILQPVSGSSKLTGARDTGEVGQFGHVPRADVELSRFGAYLVAMNGDPRKTEVAAAQTYFATATRWAETAQRTGFDLPRNFAEALELAAKQTRALEAAEEASEVLRKQRDDAEEQAAVGKQLAEDAAAIANARGEKLERVDRQLGAALYEVGAMQPKADAYDAFLNTLGAYPLATAAQMLGMGRQTLIQLLGSWKVLVIRPGHSDHLRPYTEHLHEGRFTVKSQDVPIVHKNGEAEVITRGTTLVTPKGLDYIRRRQNREALRTPGRVNGTVPSVV